MTTKVTVRNDNQGTPMPSHVKEREKKLSDELRADLIAGSKDE